MISIGVDLSNIAAQILSFHQFISAVPNTSKFNVILGAQLFGGILQKGLKSLADCLKKCANAGSKKFGKCINILTK